MRAAYGLDRFIAPPVFRLDSGQLQEQLDRLRSVDARRARPQPGLAFSPYARCFEGALEQRLQALVATGIRDLPQDGHSVGGSALPVEQELGELLGNAAASRGLALRGEPTTEHLTELLVPPVLPEQDLERLRDVRMAGIVFERRPEDLNGSRELPQLAQGLGKLDSARDRLLASEGLEPGAQLVCQLGKLAARSVQLDQLGTHGLVWSLHQGFPIPVTGNAQGVRIRQLESELAEAGEHPGTRLRLVGQDRLERTTLAALVVHAAADVGKRLERLARRLELRPGLGRASRARQLLGRARNVQELPQESDLLSRIGLGLDLSLTGLQQGAGVPVVIRNIAQALERRACLRIGIQCPAEGFASPGSVDEGLEPDLSELRQELGADFRPGLPTRQLLEEPGEIRKALALGEELPQAFGGCRVIDALERPAVGVLSSGQVLERPDAEVGQLAQEVGGLSGTLRVLGAPLEQPSALSVPAEGHETAVERLQCLAIAGILLQQQLEPLGGQLGPSFTLLQHGELEQAHLRRSVYADELLECHDQVLALARAPKQPGAQLLHVDVSRRHLVCEVRPVERGPQVGSLPQLQRGGLQCEAHTLGGISQRFPESPLQLVDPFVLPSFGLDLDQAPDRVRAVGKLTHDLAEQGADPFLLRWGQELDHLAEHVAARGPHQRLHTDGVEPECLLVPPEVRRAVRPLLQCQIAARIEL